MTEIPWESNASGDCARFREPGHKKKTPSMLKQEAITRMIDVSLISAQFNGAPRVFEPRFWVILDSGASMEFFGLYFPAFSSPGEDTLLCIRKGVWRKIHSSDSLVPSDTIENFFFPHDAVKAISDNFRGLETHVSNGLQLLDSSRGEKSAWESIRLYLETNALRLELKYSLAIKSETYVENSVSCLKELLNQLDTNCGVVPDRLSHRISYRVSALDQIGRPTGSETF